MIFYHAHGYIVTVTGKEKGCSGKFKVTVSKRGDKVKVIVKEMFRLYGETWVYEGPSLKDFQKDFPCLREQAAQKFRVAGEQVNG